MHLIISYLMRAFILLSISTVPCWSSSSKDESDSDRSLSATNKKTVNSPSSTSDEELDNITEGMGRLLTQEKSKQSEKKPKKKKLKSSHSFNLARFKDAESPLIQYTQQLKVNEETFDLDRDDTQKFIEEVFKASNNKTFLLAQGIWMSAGNYWSKPFTISQSFLDVHEISSQKMAWVSHDAPAEINKTYYIRKPQGNWGGHAEPQLISDLEDAFSKNSDAVVKYFIPGASNKEDIHMCGLELFAPYDMCDAYNGEGNNQYDCIGKLIQFRKDHQLGQKSISRAIRDKLKDRFKGKKEDAFVVIYHAKYPYSNVYTYKAEDEEDLYSLTFSSNDCQFRSEYCDKNLDVNYRLSQHKSICTEPDILYGYIHQIADKVSSYSKKSGFSFQ